MAPVLGVGKRMAEVVVEDLGREDRKIDREGTKEDEMGTE